MQKFTTLHATAAPLRRSNVDTDQILPAMFLKRITKTGFEDALFYHWRQDPDFLLNRPEYQGVEILLAGTDFGTGSSREHAVWALRDFGFKVVFSPRFADIFRGNAGKQGLLAAQLPAAEIAELCDAVEADPSQQLTVDLVERTVAVGEKKFSFQVDDYTRWRLLEGLDDISLTLQNSAAIDEFEARRPRWMPTVPPPEPPGQVDS